MRASIGSSSAPPAARLTASSLARRLGAFPTGSSAPAYRVLAEQIRGAVLDGRISVSSGLPSERELAGAVALSRTTVAAAYALLRAEGWLDSRRGSGSRITLPSSARPVPPVTGEIFGRPMSIEPNVIDLSTASLPAPQEQLTAAINAALANLPAYLSLDGYAPFGLPVLREAIARHYAKAGAPTRPEQILVTNGAQHALTVALHALSDPGDRVLVESPTYPVALDAIRSSARVPVPANMLCEDVGDTLETDWDIEMIATILRQSAPRLAYLIPDFQNPTGALMTEEQREQLVSACRRSGTTLLVDESFRDVPFGPDPLPSPMAAVGEPDRLLCLGSVSKSFWGGLRIGWIRAAEPIIERLGAARALGDMSGPVLEQLIVAEMLADPAEALAGQRDRLAAGVVAARQAIADAAPGWRSTNPGGGAFLWVRLPGPYAVDLARLAPTVGVRFAAGPRFGLDGTMASYLRLPFTAPDSLAEAVRRLVAISGQASVSRPAELPGWIA